MHQHLILRIIELSFNFMNVGTVNGALPGISCLVEPPGQVHVELMSRTGEDLEHSISNK